MGPVGFYLVLYNFAQFFGWSYILAQVVISQSLGPEEVWKRVSEPLFIFQNAAILECLHALVGIVKTPVATTLVQVASRVFLTAVSWYIPEAQVSWTFSLMVGSWAITEAIRYLYYGLNQIGAAPYPLLWLRYTTFIILYPSGISGELGVLYYSLEAIKKIDVMWYYAVIVVMLTYLPGSPYMYTHMLAQRRKYLNPKPQDSKKQQ